MSVSLKTSLLDALETLPSSLHILPIRPGTKAPVGQGWQRPETWKREKIPPLVESEKCTALGLLLGPPSGGILAVDLDGFSTTAWVEAHTGAPIDQALPESVSWTSGRPGRRQVGYLVPQGLWGSIKTTKIPTGTGEALELRWSGSQSVIVGQHPSGSIYTYPPGGYWTERDPAPCPEWILEHLLNAGQEPSVSRSTAMVRPTARCDYTSAAGSVPLEVCLSRENRDLLAHGAPQGHRNDSGFKLAADLIGVASWLDSQGIPYDGTPEALLREFASQCNPSLSEREVQSIWKSAERSRPQPALSEDKLMNCIESWQRRNNLAAPYRTLVNTRPVGLSGFSMSTGISSSSVVTPDIEMYRRELEKLASLTDTVERDLRIASLARTYGVRAETVTTHVKGFQAPETESAGAVNLAEFLSAEEATLTWLFPGLIAQGETVLLAGAPKSGKTLLAVDMAYSVVTGDNQFLGENVTPGRVLFVSTDESPNSTRLKLSQRGFGVEHGERMRIMTRFDILNMEPLRAELERFKPLLVIVDSLKSITRSTDISENSPEFANSIYALKELFGAYNTAGVLIHHEGKDRTVEGIARVRGSSAIAGAVWGILQLSVNSENGQRTLDATLRDAPGQKMTLSLEPDYSWRRHLEPGEQQARTHLDRVVALLRSRGPLEAPEIEDVLRIGDGLRKILARGVDYGKLGRRKSTTSNGWVYELPQLEGEHLYSKRDSVTVVSHPLPQSVTPSLETSTPSALEGRDSPPEKTPTVTPLSRQLSRAIWENKANEWEVECL